MLSDSVACSNAQCSDQEYSGSQQACQLEMTPEQGGIEVNSKTVALKSQISSAKFQINLKFQYSTRGASACAACDQNIRQHCRSR